MAGVAWYNENDAYPAQWLRNLIAAGPLPSGEVDERSIVEVQPNDVPEVAHFFAGIGGWPLALRLAGWPDDRPVWTGSCPCQPFSVAGKRGGTTDARHLWPEWFRLIRECRPNTIFGEQVAGSGGLAWFDLVSADLEGIGYAIGALVAPACSVGAPHRRERLYFVAEDADRIGRRGREEGLVAGEAGQAGRVAESTGGKSGDGELQRGGQHGQWTQDGRIGGVAHQSEREVGDAGQSREGTVADAATSRRGERRAGEAGDDGAPREQPAGLRSDGSELGDAEGPDGRVPVFIRRSQQAGTEPRGTGPTNGFWADAEWLPCSDGKARPTQPGLFPLAHGVPSRVGRLRAYGNAVVVPQAAAFVRAYMEALA